MHERGCRRFSRCAGRQKSRRGEHHANKRATPGKRAPRQEFRQLGLRTRTYIEDTQAQTKALAGGLEGSPALYAY
jgi:hypothetical protein